MDQHINVHAVDDTHETKPSDVESQQDAIPLRASGSPGGFLGKPILNSLVEPIVTASEQRRASDRRRSSAASEVAKQLGIAGRPLTVMLLALLVGLGCSFALHGYYSSLDGTVVGDADDQQLSLRIGTALAFFAQVSLVYSIQKAFTQWLWRELKRETVSFKGIDAAWAATSDPLSFLSPEMLVKVKIASALAFVSWLIPISSVIAPATLNVNPVLLNNTQVLQIPRLDISQASAYERFSFAVNGSTPSQQKYGGARTIIDRLSVAVAATGEILTLPRPATNASYLQSFFGPYIQCNNSTDEVRGQINGMIDRANAALSPSVQLISLDYFAAVPALGNVQNMSSGPVQVANLTSLSGPLNASNQLWMYVPQYSASSNFSQTPVPHFLTCELYNASYTTLFAWENGRQNIQVVNRSLLSPVPYPINGSKTAASEEDMSFSAVMWAISGQLTGSIAFYKDLNTTEDATEEALSSTIYSSISTNLAQTVLIGSSDLDSHFIENHRLDKGTNSSSLFSDQRLQDMGYVANKSLDVLIPELSSNSTISFITDNFLAPLVQTNVTLTSLINTYSYQSRNVLIAYALAGSVAVVANVLGLYAFFKSGVSHDLSFSSIACSTHNVHFSVLRAHERLGALPLEPRIARTRLVFHQGDEGRWGFGAANGALMDEVD